MKLLLDVHVRLVVASQLRSRGVVAASVAKWQGGHYREAPDDDILHAARSDERVLVSYDQKTIPKLLLAWSNARWHHAGVILVDSRTIPPQDVGGLLRALSRLVDE